MRHHTIVSRARIAAALTLGVSLAACSSDHTTGPSSLAACGGSGQVQLGELQSATVACPSGTDVVLAGGGATYLVVPQFAVGNVPNRSIPYTIGVVGEKPLPPAPTVVPGASLSRLPLSRSSQTGEMHRDRRQRAFDAALLAASRKEAASAAWGAGPPRAVRVPAAPLRASAPPPVGSLRTFHVISTFNAQSPTYAAVTARLEYAGANILLYVDTLSPSNGFTPAQLQSFGQLFDQTLYPIDVNAFGSPSDIDQNGRLIMLLSPVVNGLSPAAQCDTQGYVGGFFYGHDLIATDTSSNQGEIFYGIVPDPTGTASCPHSVDELLLDVPAIFMHEVQHLIDFSQHVLAHGGQPEQGWLDEGLSIVAEELGSLYYEQKYPPPAGRSNPAQLFPDSSQGFIGGLLVDSYQYLLETDTVTVTLHSDAENGLAWRGGDWLLVRWLGDHEPSGYYKKLEQSTLTGTANIAAAAGESFPSLFGDFSLAVYADSLPGIPKSSVPGRDRFAYRTLRRMYQRLYDTSRPSSMFPRPFPIVPTPLAGPISATMVPGTMAFYTLSTSSGQGPVTLRFASPGGAPLAANLAPQVSIFRLPPGT